MNKIFLIKCIIIILLFTIPFWLWVCKYNLFERYKFFKREEFIWNEFKSKTHTSKELDSFLAKKNRRIKIYDFFDKYMNLDREHYLIKEMVANFFYSIYVIISITLSLFACALILIFIVEYTGDYLKLKNYPELVKECNAIEYPTPKDILEANENVREIKKSIFILDKEKEKIDESFIFEMRDRYRKKIDEKIRS